MRTLGLIGGMTWHSTVDYYRLINEGVQKRLGGSHSAELLLLSVDFVPVEQLQEKGDWAGMGRMMGEWAKQLEDAGAEGLVICTNTMHRLAGDVQKAITIPLIHIADATAAAVKRAGLESGRAARHALHDGDGFLPGAAREGARPEGPHPGGARTDDRPRRHLQGARRTGRSGRSRAPLTSRSSRTW